MFEYYNDIHLFRPVRGANNPLGPNVFININILPICSFPASYLQENDSFHFSPFKCIDLAVK